MMVVAEYEASLERASSNISVGVALGFTGSKQRLLNNEMS